MNDTSYNLHGVKVDTWFGKYVHIHFVVPGNGRMYQSFKKRHQNMDDRKQRTPVTFTIETDGFQFCTEGLIVARINFSVTILIIPRVPLQQNKKECMRKCLRGAKQKITLSVNILATYK
jgi:hypothetical protein